MFCVITQNEHTAILKVIGKLFLELWCTQIEKSCFENNALKVSETKSGKDGAWREFLREILYKNIAIIAIQHSNMYFVDTFGDFSHTVEWNSF